MKRSEMVKALMEKFNHVFIGVHAETIIDFLESKGMLPPAYEKLVEAKGIASPSPDIKLYYKMPCNEWEPENEKN